MAYEIDLTGTITYVYVMVPVKLISHYNPTLPYLY